MDSFLVTLLVIAIAGLSNWLQQRAKSREERHEPLPPSRPIPPRATLPRPSVPGGAAPQPRPAPTIPSALERELRRLLGEEVLLERAPAPPVVPPPIHAPARVPATSSHAPAPLSMPEPAKDAGPLRESAAAYAHAQQLREKVADRIRKADPIVEKHPLKSPSTAPTAFRSGSAALAALRQDRQAVRQAFIASLVFGSPKALD